MSEQPAVRASGPDSPIPNVTWQIKDSVSACPAGDSVIAGHPSRLRILVSYMDANDDPRVGVPPESIYIGYSTGSGNAKINDKAVTVMADDPTDANGQARITIPSLSGSGNLSIGLYVSGVSIGSKTAHIRTTDADASGRDSAGENPPDINWSGSVTKADSDTDAMVASLTVTGTNVVQRPGAAELARRTGPNVVEFELAAAVGAPAILDVFDVLGRRIRRVQREGPGRMGWDGTDRDGRKAVSGIYLYRLVVGSEVRTGRVAVVR